MPDTSERIHSVDSFQGIATGMDNGMVNGTICDKFERCGKNFFSVNVFNPRTPATPSSTFLKIRIPFRGFSLIDLIEFDCNG